MSLISMVVTFLLFLFSGHLLLTNNGNRFLNRLMAILSLARACQFLNLLLSENGQLHHIPHLYKLPYPILYITPALFYLYIKGFVFDRTSLKRNEWLHFLPLLIGVADMIPWLASSATYKHGILQSATLYQAFFFQDASDLIPAEISRLLRVTLFLTYIFLSWRLVLKKGILRNMNDNPVGNTWIIFMLVLSTTGHLFLFVSLWWDAIQQDNTHAGLIASCRFAVISHLLLILFILYKPRILYGYILVSHDFAFRQAMSLESGETAGADARVGETPDLTEAKVPSINEAFNGPEKEAGKEQQLPLTTEKIQEWKESVIRYMDEEKPYLQRSFRLQNLAVALDMPQHHCSYLIKHVFDRNFNDWVNEYRVAYFIRLHGRDRSALTMEAMSKAAGFGSRRTLHNAFMKVHGQPPGSYFQELPAT